MIETILTFLANLVVQTIEFGGLISVFGLMTLESAGIPIPSEVIMPFAGFLALNDVFNFWTAVLVGALGNVFGSYLAYMIAKKGGRPLVKKMGKFVLLSERDLDKSERFFNKYGAITVLVGRVLPIVRTYISFPAGLAEMPIWPFLGYSFVGSIVWSVFLAKLGVMLGSNWMSLRDRFHGLDVGIAVVLAALIVWWVWRHIKHNQG